MKDDGLFAHPLTEEEIDQLDDGRLYHCARFGAPT
jgi:hypothetical protein